MSVDVIIEDLRWDEADLEALAARAWAAVATQLGVPDGSEIAVLGCDDARIMDLNRDFRDKPTPTNVLSWPSEERASDVAGRRPDPVAKPTELGDIAISFDTTLREADSGGISLENHAVHLLIHATLHLLGYDHEDDRDGDLMESVEIAILATLGIANPYSNGTARPDTDGKD